MNNIWFNDWIQPDKTIPIYNKLSQNNNANIYVVYNKYNPFKDQKDSYFYVCFTDSESVIKVIEDLFYHVYSNNKFKNEKDAMNAVDSIINKCDRIKSFI